MLYYLHSTLEYAEYENKKKMVRLLCLKKNRWRKKEERAVKEKKK
jgi:hypothetical protein